MFRSGGPAGPPLLQKCGLRENDVTMRNAILGILAALCLALVLSDASVFGIAAWKIVLAAVGLALFVLGGQPGGNAKR